MSALQPDVPTSAPSKRQDSILSRAESLQWQMMSEGTLWGLGKATPGCLLLEPITLM